MDEVRASLAAWFGHIGSLAHPKRWGLLLTTLTLVTNLALFASVKDPRPESDGVYNWMFARSIAFDHDINFANDYQLCGDKGNHNRDRGGGHVDNPFYVGPSLFWVPALEVARALLRISPRALESVRLGCTGPFAKVALSMGSVAGALLVWLSYCAARRLADDYVAALTAGLFAFGTTLSAYAAYFASYSHVYDGACVAALLVLSLRGYERPDRLLRWALAGLAVGVCILHRLTNAPLALLPATFAALALYKQPRRLILAWAALASTSIVFGLVPLGLIYKYFYGRYFFAPQGPYFFQPAHAHPWLLLFAPKGLFFFAPVAWLSVVGVVHAARHSPLRNVLLAVLGMFAIELYIASCPLDWDAEATVGARRLIAFFPFLILLAAAALTRITSWFSRDADRVRALVLAVLFAPLSLLFLGTGLQVAGGGHLYDFYPSQEWTYGTPIQASLGAIDRVLGGVAMLPGQIVYSLRYHAPHSTYWNATQISFLLRDQWSMKVDNARLNLGDPHLRAAMPGFVRVGDEGARVSRRGTLVFCAEWPYANQLLVRATASIPTRLSVSSRGFFGKTTQYGSIDLVPEETTYTLDIPRGGFDSGVEELVFETVGGAAQIRWVEMVDTTEYPPVK